MTPERLPSTPEITRVDVMRIQHYSRNPRRQQNPEYDRIKASIQAEGLDQPLVRIPVNVTGHSGDRDRFAHGHHAGVSFVL